ncbi:cytosolic Fe-S cluster assembly factor NUBP2 isoform X5 [Cynocephalus volans]|uniref:cytosolic Fe-S cluster assembly factor NUBP2 isoform X5 n=1 Tax=Cynocephalus volans TaxID=110931 RepID=UPI002FCC1BAF
MHPSQVLLLWSRRPPPGSRSRGRPRQENKGQRDCPRPIPRLSPAAAAGPAVTYFTPQEKPECGNLAGVRHIILILSGKGGVGKSTISTELALALRHAGKKHRLASADHMGFTALIKQFVSDVAWGELDYLVVDTPPGTSDEHIATLEALRPYKPLGALVVTTPQAVSVGDVRRELTFCRKTGLQVMGVVENMSSFVCPHCAECTNIFSRGGGEELARHAGVPFLGSVPLDPELTRSLEEGRDFIQEFPKSPAFPALISITQKILDRALAQLS